MLIGQIMLFSPFQFVQDHTRLQSIRCDKKRMWIKKKVHTLIKVKCLESGCSSVFLFACRDFPAVSSTWLHTDLPGPAAPRVWAERVTRRTRKRKWDETRTKLSKWGQWKRVSNSDSASQLRCSCKFLFSCLQNVLFPSAAALACDGRRLQERTAGL